MASETIDSLVIDISANANGSAQQIKQLATALTQLDKSVGSSGVKLSKLASGISSLGGVLKSVSTANLSNLSQLKVLNDIRISPTLGTNLQKLSGALNGLNAGAIDKLGMLRNLETLNGIKISSSVPNSIAKLAAAINMIPDNIATKIGGLTSGLLPLRGLDKLNIRGAIKGLRELPAVLAEYDKLNVRNLCSQLDTLMPRLNLLSAATERFKLSLDGMPRSFSTAAGATRSIVSANAKLNDDFKTSRFTLTGLINKYFVLTGALYVAKGSIGKCVNDVNSYIENMNLFEASMGQYTKEATEYGMMLQNVMGIDFGEWARNQGVFQTLITGMGETADHAKDMSKQLTQLGYDISSFYNISVDEAMLKLQSGVAGELEPLRRLGWDLSVARMQLEATKLGIDENVNSMTQAEKVGLRYYMIMNQVTQVHGDMARTLNSPANQLRILQAQLTLAARAIGNLFIPMVNAILPIAIGAAKAIRFLAETIASFFGIDAKFEVDYSGLDTSGISTGGTDDLADSLDNVGKQAGGANKKMKELQKSVMGFDELNKLNDNKDDNGAGGGGGAGGVGGGAGKFKLPIDKYDFLKGLQDKLSKITDDIGKKLANAFKRLLPFVAGIGAAIGAWKLRGKLLKGLAEMEKHLGGIQSYVDARGKKAAKKAAKKRAKKAAKRRKRALAKGEVERKKITGRKKIEKPDSDIDIIDGSIGEPKRKHYRKISEKPKGVRGKHVRAKHAKQSKTLWRGIDMSAKEARVYSIDEYEEMQGKHAAQPRQQRKPFKKKLRSLGKKIAPERFAEHAAKAPTGELAGFEKAGAKIAGISSKLAKLRGAIKGIGFAGVASGIFSVVTRLVDLSLFSEKFRRGIAGIAGGFVTMFKGLGGILKNVGGWFAGIGKQVGDFTNTIDNNYLGGALKSLCGFFTDLGKALDVDWGDAFIAISGGLMLLNPATAPLGLMLLLFEGITLAVRAVGDALSPCAEQVDNFAGVSEEGAERFGSSIDSMRGAMREIEEDSWGDKIITEEDVQSIEKKTNDIKNTIINNLDANKNAELKQVDFMSRYLTEDEVQAAKDRINGVYENEKQSTIAGTNEVQSILQKASTEKRSLTEDESNRINEILGEQYQRMLDTSGAGAEDIAKISENMKNNKEADALAAAETVIGAAIKTRDEAIENANQQYDGVVEQAKKMYQAGEISKERYDEITKAAETDRDNTVKATNDKFDKVCKKTREGLGDVSNKFDFTTGKTKTKWQMFTEGVSKTWNDVWTAITGFWNNTIMPIFNNICGFFASVGEQISKFLSDPVGYIQGIWQGICDWFYWNVIKPVTDAFNDIVENITRPFRDAKRAIEDIFGRIHIKWSHFDLPFGGGQISVPTGIAFYANGGFPDVGQLFMARENGIPEMVGSMGGKNAVANNAQIVEGIEQGVMRAMLQVLPAFNSNNGTDGNVTMVLNVGNEELARAVNKGNASLMRRGQVDTNVMFM